VKSGAQKTEFRPFDSVEESITEGSINNSFEDPSLFLQESVTEKKMQTPRNLIRPDTKE